MSLLPFTGNLSRYLQLERKAEAYPEGSGERDDLRDQMDATWALLLDSEKDMLNQRIPKKEKERLQ